MKIEFNGTGLAYSGRRNTVKEDTLEAFRSVDTTRLLVTAMNLAQDNHRIIANNIANADTPGFNPVEVDFEATLRKTLEGRGSISLRKTRPQHLESSRMRPQMKSLVFLAKNDYNKVDIEQETANLSKNAGRYNLYASLVSKQFQVAKSMLTNAR